MVTGWPHAWAAALQEDARDMDAVIDRAIEHGGIDAPRANHRSGTASIRPSR